jgi:hypothetical protein
MRQGRGAAGSEAAQTTVNHRFIPCGTKEFVLYLQYNKGVTSMTLAYTFTHDVLFKMLFVR